MDTVAGGGIGGTAPGFVDGIGSAARFFEPHGLAFSSAGKLYIADRSNNVIRLLDVATRLVTTVAGGGSAGGTAAGYANGVATAALFSQPWGIATDDSAVYVSDAANNVIRLISIATSMVTLLAGSNSTAAGRADGAGTEAAFNTPRFIALAPSGALVVADRENKVIRSICLASPSALPTPSRSASGTRSRSSAPSPTVTSSTTPSRVAASLSATETATRSSAATTPSPVQGAVIPLGSGQSLTLAFGNSPTTWTAPASGCWANITLAGAGGGTYSIAPAGEGGAGAVFNILAWLPPSSSVVALTSAAGSGSLQGGPATAVYFGVASGGGIIAVAGGGGAGAKGPALGGAAGPPGGAGLAGNVTPGAAPELGGHGGSQTAPGAAGVGNSTCGTTPNMPPTSGNGRAGGAGAMCGSATGSMASGGWAPGGAAYSSNHKSAGGGGGGGWFGGGGGAAASSTLTHLGGGGGGECVEAGSCPTRGWLL